MFRLGAILLFGAVILAPQPRNVRTVTLTCGNGWRAGAGGVVGGVAYSVTCDNGRGKARLVGVIGNAYTARVGVESDSVAADCFYSGDAAVVNERCIDVHLSIH